MNGFKKSKERLNLLINLDKIVFISKWVQDRFFINLDKKLSDKTEIIYPISVNNLKKKLKKKKDYICWKINTSKGYDIYKDAIIKISK